MLQNRANFRLITSQHSSFTLSDPNIAVTDMFWVVALSFLARTFWVLGVESVRQFLCDRWLTHPDNIVCLPDHDLREHGDADE